jgi:drug/metabolite transporter (DMT)-like permease
VIILLPFLRKLPVRARAIVGALVAVLGVAALFVPGQSVAGAIACAVGVIFLASAWRSRRRTLVAG